MADSGTYDQATLIRRQKLAEQMLAEDSKPKLVRHWAEGLANIANTGVDAFNLNRLDKQAAESRKADTAALMAGLGLMGGQPAPPAAPASAPSVAPSSPVSAPPTVLGAGGKPEMPDAQGAYSADAVMMPQSSPSNAIAGIESGGKYDALGPVIPKTGDRAYGKYQVMGANIPEWTKTHLGQSMTPEQFIASHEAQEAVFKGEFGRLSGKYGPEGAARAWFAGEGGMNDPNRRDPLGTSVADYSRKFTAAGGGGPQAIAAAMTPAAFAGVPPQGPSPVGAAGPVPPGGAPVPGAGPSSIGIPDVQKAMIARLLSASPGSTAQQLGMTMLANASKPHDFGFQTLPDGTILRTDPRSGTVAPIYQAPTKPSFGVIGEDQFGNKKYGWIDANKRTADAIPDVGASAPGAAPLKIQGPDGKMIDIPPGADPKEFRKKITDINADAAGGKNTETQQKADQFASRMELAEKNVAGLEGEGGGFSGAAQQVLGKTPIIGSAMQSGNYQKFDQAKSQFITALLRQESGAAIGRAEFERYDKELFPQPGDIPEVVAQKRESRRAAIAAMRRGAGPGSKPAADIPAAPPAVVSPAAPKVGEEKQFKQGVGVWDGTKWVPKAATGGPSA